MTVIEVRFELEKETKGALRYQEIDENGDSRVDPSELIRTPIPSLVRPFSTG